MNKNQNKKPTKNRRKIIKYNYKKFTMRLTKPSYDRLKKVQATYNRNPINPYTSLNHLINNCIINKYPKVLITRLKKHAITQEQYEHIKDSYTKTINQVESTQELLSNIANNCNQIAKRLNSIHDSNNPLDSDTVSNIKNFKSKIKGWEAKIDKNWSELIKTGDE